MLFLSNRIEVAIIFRGFLRGVRICLEVVLRRAQECGRGGSERSSREEEIYVYLCTNWGGEFSHRLIYWSVLVGWDDTYGSVGTGWSRL